MVATKALARLRMCADPPEPLLLSDYKHASTKFSCTGLYIFIAVVTCFHPNAIRGGQYYRETNNGSEVEVQKEDELEFNTTLRFKCNSGYELSGNFSLINRTCQENEIWSEEEPRCIGMQAITQAKRKNGKLNQSI